MSKIKAELMAAAAITTKRGESDEDLNKRLITAISEVDDPTWNAISEPAKDWFNEAATAVNKKKAIPAFPDAEAAQEAPAARTRTRASAAEPELPLDPQVGDAVTAVTKRGKTLVGTIVEIDDDVVVLDVDGKEEELARDRLTSLVVNKSSRTTNAPDSSPEPETKLAVGMKVTAVTKRGKTLVGTIVEIDDDVVVLDVDGKEEELARDRLTSLEPVAAAKPAPERAGRTQSTEKGKPDAEKPATQPRVTAKANGGVSVTTRIRELIASDLGMSKGEVGKQLRTEGLEFRDNTLDLTYAETHKVVTALRDAGQLQG